MPEIQKELIERRTANSKTFDIGNGRRQLIAHIGDVHYKDNYANPSELWKDIDLTWEGNRITKAPYELTHEGNKLTLKNKRTGNITTLELDSIGGKKIPDVAWERSKGLARIPNIALDADLEVIAEFSAVRFRRILKSDKAPQEAEFKVTGDTSLIRMRASDEDGDIPVESSLQNGMLTETLKPSRAVKYPVRIDPTWQVGDGDDDASLNILTNFSLVGDFAVGYHDATHAKRGTGLRFTNITIPQGATINNGTHLTLRCSWGVPTGTDCLSRISAEDVDNAITFTLDNAASFLVRWDNRTTARVDWDNIATWTLNTDYNSPEIKTVIKEIVDRGGWNSGQAIVIFWEDFEDRSTHSVSNERWAYSYNDSVEFAPKLVIDYSVVTHVTVEPPLTSIASDSEDPTTTLDRIFGAPHVKIGWENVEA